jgi:Spy/CpxP family protein refolding chaperone
VPEGGTLVYASGGGSADANPVSLEERIARLEHDQKTMRTERGTPFRFSERFARSTDDLARQLSLTSTQRTRVEDVIGRARQRIEDVLKIPDETGKSPFERRTEARKKIEEAMKNPQPGGVLAFAADVFAYHDQKIPGRNDTYGDEIGRIRKEAREEIATALDAKQQETFQETNMDGLIGEAGQMSFAYAIGSGTQGGEAEMVVEMGADIHSVAPGGEEPPPEPPGSGGK